MDILFHFSAMLESGQVWTLAFVPLFVIRSRRSISLFLLVKNRFVYRSPLSLSSKMILNINSERFISRNQNLFMNYPSFLDDCIYDKQPNTQTGAL